MIDTRMGLSPFPNWTLEEHRREGTVIMGVKRFDAMAVDSKILET